MKKRVLIIGSGERVQGGILPALQCLNETHDIIALHSRTVKQLLIPGTEKSITTTNTLDRVDMKTINLIMVAVTTKNVPDVLKMLSQYDTKNAVLMLDTPVLTVAG